MKGAIKLFLVFCITLTTSYAFAGAWVRKKNSGYTQLSFTFLRYHRLINGNRLIDLKRTISDHTLQFYSEYGITDKLTFIDILPYKFLKSHSDIRTALDNHPFRDTLLPGTFNGFSNITAGLKYALVQKSYVMSAQILFGAPSVQFNRSTGLRTGYSAFLITPSVLIGKGSEKQYFSSELGFQFRTNNYAQNFIGSIEYGYKLFQKICIIGVIDAMAPVTKGSYNDGAAEQTGLYVDNQVFIAFGGKVNYSVTKHISLNFSGFGSIYTEKGGAFPSLTAGLSYEW